MIEQKRIGRPSQGGATNPLLSWMKRTFFTRRFLCRNNLSVKIPCSSLWIKGGCRLLMRVCQRFF